MIKIMSISVAIAMLAIVVLATILGKTDTPSLIAFYIITAGWFVFTVFVVKNEKEINENKNKNLPYFH